MKIEAFFIVKVEAVKLNGYGNKIPEKPSTYSGTNQNVKQY